MKRRSGGSASPYDHSPTTEDELLDGTASDDVIGRAQRIVMADDGPDGVLTPMRITAMEMMVKSGVAIPVAATAIKCQRFVGAWTATARRHIAAGQTPGFGAGESPYALFLETMDSARAFHEATVTAAITNAATLDWRAGAWLLERRYSKRWYLQQKVDAPDKNGETLKEMSVDRLLEIAKGKLPVEKPMAQLPSNIQDAEIVEEKK